MESETPRKEWAGTADAGEPAPFPEPYRVYLRAELSKPEHDSQYGDAEAIGAFLAEASPEKLRHMVKEFSSQRNNDVFRKLEDYRCATWFRKDVDIRQIELQQAEESLGEAFKANDWMLVRIAGDENILRERFYCDQVVPSEVAFPCCLAVKRGSHYRVFDGMHRAIQLVRNGAQVVPLCFVENVDERR